MGSVTCCLLPLLTSNSKVKETRAEKRARLVRELQDLAEEDEAIVKEELRKAEEELTLRSGV
jgi:predicted transcriptional regulator